MRPSAPPRPSARRPQRTPRPVTPRVPAPHHDRWVLRTLTSLLVVAVLAAAAVAFYEANTDGTIYSGVRLGGVDVGGLSRAEALQRLRAASLTPATGHIAVLAAGQQWDIAPAQLGAALDVPASVDAAYSMGRTGGPLQRLSAQIHLLVNGRALPLVESYDPAALDAYARVLAAQVARAPRPAALVVMATGPLVQPRQDGARLDLVGATAALATALKGGAATIHLPVTTVPAPRDASALRAEMARLSRLLGTHITITALGHSWTLTRADLAALWRVDTAVHDGRVSYSDRVDHTAATAYVWPRVTALAQPGRDARLLIDGASVRVLAGRDGRVVDSGAAVALLAAAVSRGRDITLALPVVNGPTVTTAEASAVAARLRLTLRGTVVWLPTRHWMIPPATIARALTIQRVAAITGARLVPHLDASAIAAALPGSAALASNAPRKAAVVTRGGHTVHIPAVDGHRPDYAALVAEMLASPTPPGRAVYHLPIAPIPPAS